jgi:uncharacterized membrane protein YkvI
MSPSRTDIPASWVRRYLMPGLVFKAAVIGGAYSSGRELAQFFAPHGAWGGLLGMLAAMLLWSAVFAVSLEFARISRAYDYRTFFRALLGRYWVPVEVLMILLLLLIVSVLSAAASEMLHTLTHIPLSLAIAIFALGVSATLALGTKPIESFLSYWSVVLYTFYAVFLVLAVVSFGPLIRAGFADSSLTDIPSAVTDGVRYGAYNIAAIAMVLFVARTVTTRREAVVAGLLGGPLAMLPAALFFIAMSAFHPQIANEVLPVNFLMQRMNIPYLPQVYLAVICVTLVGAAATTLHSLNQRIAVVVESRGGALSASARFSIAVVAIGISVLASLRFGLVDLVARGYGYIAFGFIAFFIVPVLTVGLWRIRAQRANV